MEKWFEASETSLVAITLSAIGIFILVILYTRIAGKRSFSKMSSFDFAMTIASGSILASTIVLKNVSLVQGAIALLVVYILQLVTAYLRRYPAFQKITDNDPILLMKDGEIYYDNLKKARVTESDLRGKLREANVIQLSEVRAVVFETTGDVSVLHSADKKLEDWIIKDVNRK
ncbi:DUF421 domain-containing protein [Zunongwangia sp. SCSIO 43204]|uniref:DUF421 domain-containing protein n=1 Tax=Zunongwangia mangrovi TaxID=1334022 RepID=A0A1I1EH79_9FLAO|nr:MULTISPECIES: YetF domain-containing protein [Zunongwangia]UAB85734.1 DUF421 domain-containing protein [Zunongwangia sp. SCSIO 43204]SFB86529.1 Protein of unknown function [Zunongwangia mangrovi]